MRLFENEPEMPTLRDMHRIIAAHPSVQAKLFLLSERVLLEELLGIQGAFIGSQALVSGSEGLPDVRKYEDDFASNGEPGLANFAAALLEPLESQARGFAHGHKEFTGVPRASEEKLRKLFEQSDDVLRRR